MRVYARNTTLSSVDNSEALSFVEHHHRQGVAQPGKNLRSFGLYSAEGELLAVALFCNPRTSGMQRKYTTELFRMAFKDGVRIPGGASKLIKGFLNAGGWDLFTYQDTAGEATDVYELAGGKLRGSKHPTKQVLVKNGLTKATASNNRRDWFSLELASRLGPDALIGTALGEVLDENGKRKSNIRLFTEDCGYHLETVPGDRVYEWQNPAVTFYVYKLTSSKDNGYYYGRHVIRNPYPTDDDCLRDGYMGSGGRKFQGWVAKVGKESLVKTVVAKDLRWAEAVALEKKMVGDSHLSDPDCKNFQPGGVGLSRVITVTKSSDCPEHGRTLHRGEKCMKCSSQKAVAEKFCDTHGLSLHMGESCRKCQAASSWSKDTCELHGETPFRKDRCEKCNAEARVSLRTCSIHGVTKHQGETCGKCSSLEAFKPGQCPIHGSVTLRGKACTRCAASLANEVKLCPEHGKTWFIGEVCRKCTNSKTVSYKQCPIHGNTKHIGDSCATCSHVAIQVKDCPEHGAVKHAGDYCFMCGQAGLVTNEVCPIHGETKFQHGRCASCVAEEKFSLRLCKVHGESKHIGSKCSKCVASKVSSLRECVTHGVTKHSGDVCRKCISAKQNTLAECEWHGFVKHRGASCAKCSSEKTAHKRFHKDVRTDCRLCNNDKA